MDIKNLNTFILVAELGSFSRAGERLGYSQPTVSVQIRQLEQELGVRLFDRIGHAVRLTDGGREALLYAQQVCHIAQQMTHSAGQSEAVSTIRLATSDSLCSALMFKALPSLRSQFPWIHLTLTTAGTEGLFRLLDQNEADLVCTLDSHIYNANYVTAAEEKIGVHFVVSSRSPLAQARYLSREDLLTQDFLLTEDGMSYRRLLTEWLARYSIQLQPVLETGSTDLICRLVEQGMGMSFLPDYVTEDAVRRGTVVRLDAEDFQPELWKQLLYRRDKWISRAMEAVIRHLSAVLLDSPDAGCIRPDNT